MEWMNRLFGRILRLDATLFGVKIAAGWACYMLSDFVFFELVTNTSRFANIWGRTSYTRGRSPQSLY
jgi:hypothetical protein